MWCGTALSLVHPKIVSRRIAPLPDPHTYHGPEGVLEIYDDWTADFGEFELDPARGLASSDDSEAIA